MDMRIVYDYYKYKLKYWVSNKYKSMRDFLFNISYEEYLRSANSNKRAPLLTKDEYFCLWATKRKGTKNLLKGVAHKTYVSTTTKTLKKKIGG